MSIEMKTASNWFEVRTGKVYGRCPICHSRHISFHKVRRPGLKGISAKSSGLVPACLDCGENLPGQNQPVKKEHLQRPHPHHTGQ